MGALITYRPNSQKIIGLFDKILTNEILTDICKRVTGQSDYTIKKDLSSYNRGRLLIIYYNGIKNYVSISETEINGRNSSLQSVPTAINLFFADTENCPKRIFYYFMPHTGLAFTSYHMLVYRLLKTSGVSFLNYEDYNQNSKLESYTSVDEIILDRDNNRSQKSSNNSSFISKTIDKVQIYAKVYGASKYESTLFALAISKITEKPIDLFNICEQDLTSLPAASLHTISELGNISIHDTTLTLEKKHFIENCEKGILRSPRYQYNLLQRLGHKHCALCNCEIQEIIQGAHIWGVSQIAHSDYLDDDEKFEHAINGHNGLWLCQNHHKLFDSNLIALSPQGQIMISKELSHEKGNYIKEITNKTSLADNIITDNFKWYISQRNIELDLKNHILLAI